MNRPTDWIAAALAVVGALFALLAAVGILRMPDLFTRMHAASKAGTLGACCTVLAAAVYFHQADVAVRAVLTVLFLLLTAPVAAHVIGRGGYIAGAELSPETVIDEFGGPAPTPGAAGPDAAGVATEGPRPDGP